MIKPVRMRAPDSQGQADKNITQGLPVLPVSAVIRTEGTHSLSQMNICRLAVRSNTWALGSQSCSQCCLQCATCIENVANGSRPS